MTINEFLEDIERRRANGEMSFWVQEGTGYILSEEDNCPIQEVGIQTFDDDDLDDIDLCATSMGLKLGLSQRAITSIMFAADGQHCALRQRLLKACGIEEPHV